VVRAPDGRMSSIAVEAAVAAAEGALAAGAARSAALRDSDPIRDGSPPAPLRLSRPTRSPA
jgi:hypothetical protein